MAKILDTAGGEPWRLRIAGEQPSHCGATRIRGSSAQIERVGDRPERPGSLEGMCLAPVDRNTDRPAFLEEPMDEARLADPGLAFDDQRRPLSAMETVHEASSEFQLTLPAYEVRQRPRHDSDTTGLATERRYSAKAPLGPEPRLLVDTSLTATL